MQSAMPWAIACITMKFAIVVEPEGEPKREVRSGIRGVVCTGCC
jgi:hypothetical protein